MLRGGNNSIKDECMQVEKAYVAHLITLSDTCLALALLQPVR